MHADPSFADFLTRLRQGDDQAARVLVERFGQRLLAKARQRLDARVRGRVEPEDVVQSALLSVCMRLRDGQFELTEWTSLQGLLVTVTLRKCGRWHDYYFSQSRDVGREQPLTTAGGATADPADREPEPVEVLMLEEAAARMVAGLGADEREYVRLRLEGHELREISERLGCDYQRVWRTLRLVQERLSRMLEP